MFCLLAIVGTVLLKTDRPLAAIGRAAAALRNRITRGRRPPLTRISMQRIVPPALAELEAEAPVLPPGDGGVGVQVGLAQDG